MRFLSIFLRILRCLSIFPANYAIFVHFYLNYAIFVYFFTIYAIYVHLLRKLCDFCPFIACTKVKVVGIEPAPAKKLCTAADSNNHCDTGGRMK